jgi:hypothetical protein
MRFYSMRISRTNVIVACESVRACIDTGAASYNLRATTSVSISNMQTTQAAVAVIRLCLSDRDLGINTKYTREHAHHGRDFLELNITGS